MYDFCITPIYALIVGLGGAYGYYTKGSVSSLAGGGISGVLLLILTYISYTYYKVGKNCRPAVFFSLVISFCLSVMMYQRYTETGTLYTASMAFLSVAVSLYYVFNFTYVRVKRTASQPRRRVK